MKDFIEIAPTKLSITNRKLILGHGINDAKYLTNIKIDGKRRECPFYQRWKNMLMRCYDPKYHARKPTYKECSVCDEWLTFSNFKSWMIKQDWNGKQLDKDLLVKGNKIYSPDKCLFVSSQVNSLLSDSAAIRGAYPIGVFWHSKNNNFIAKCKVKGKNIHIGSFPTVESAFFAYKKFKSKLIRDMAEKQSEPLRSALLSRAYV